MIRAPFPDDAFSEPDLEQRERFADDERDGSESAVEREAELDFMVYAAELDEAAQRRRPQPIEELTAIQRRRRAWLWMLYLGVCFGDTGLVKHALDRVRLAPGLEKPPDRGHENVRIPRGSPAAGERLTLPGQIGGSWEYPVTETGPGLISQEELEELGLGDPATECCAREFVRRRMRELRNEELLEAVRETSDLSEAAAVTALEVTTGRKYSKRWVRELRRRARKEPDAGDNSLADHAA